MFVRGSNNKAYRNSFVVPTVIFGDGGVIVKGAYRTRALDFKLISRVTLTKVNI